jgi:hypothetical protein
MVKDIIVVIIKTDGKIDKDWLFKANCENYKNLKFMSERYNIVKSYEEHINKGDYQKAQQRLNNKAKEAKDEKDDIW